MPMLLTITLILSTLVIVNLLLLKFSCNKTIKINKIDKKPIVLKTQFYNKEDKQILAPTGS